MRKPNAKTMGMDVQRLRTILYRITENCDYIIGHDGRSTPPINTNVRLNLETGNGIIILETGNSMLATKLANEQVFWKIGRVDFILFTILKDNMVSTIAKGWLAIIKLSIIIGIVRYRRKKKI